MPDYHPPSWGEIGSIVGNLVFAGQTSAVAAYWPEASYAFAAAEALSVIREKLPPELYAVVCKVMTRELTLQREACPQAREIRAVI